MKALLRAITGFVYGAALSWGCLYIFSHLDWPRPDEVTSACGEIGKCPGSWWSVPLLFLYWFGPALCWAPACAYRWPKWSGSRRLIWVVVFTAGTAAWIAAGYVSR